MALERELLRYCREKSDSFLLRKCFISWEKVVRLERIQHWEKERRARKHHERYACIVVIIMIMIMIIIIINALKCESLACSAFCHENPET